MPGKIAYIKCPGCRGEFYIRTIFFEVKGANCYCPFCKLEFSPQAGIVSGASQCSKESTSAK